MGDIQERTAQILTLLRTSQKGLSISQISRMIGINRNSTSMYLDVMRYTGQVEVLEKGRSKIYYPSHSLPISAWLDFSSDYILALDDELRIIEVNDKFLKLLNIKKEMLLEQSIDDTNLPFMGSGIPMDRIKRALDKEFSNIEVSLKLNLDRLDFRGKLVPTNLGDGRNGVTIILENVTEGRLAQRRIRESERKFRSLFQNSPNAILLLDEKGIFDFNERTRKLFRIYDSEGILGKHPADLSPPEQSCGTPSKKKANDYISLVLRKGHARFEWLHMRTNGEIFPCEITLSPVEIHGRTAIQAIIRDITELKRSKERLISLSSAFRMSSDAICMTDFYGTVLEANDSLLRMLGMKDRSEIIGTDGLRLLFPGERDRARDNMITLFEKGTDSNIKYDVKGIDGRNFTIEVSASVLKDVDGIPTGFITISRDVTEREKYLKGLERSSRILKALGLAALSLIDGKKGSELVNDTLGSLGEATDVSRVYIFKVSPFGSEKEVHATQLFEWCDRGIEPQMNNPDLRDFAMIENGFERWVSELSDKRYIQGRVDSFPEAERDVLESQDILSIAVVPIHSDSEWWGFIGFDDCINSREWLPAEIEALRTAGKLLLSIMED